MTTTGYAKLKIIIAHYTFIGKAGKVHASFTVSSHPSRSIRCASNRQHHDNKQ